MHDKASIRAGKLLIRQALLEEWDPIGIRHEPEAQDEYDAYLGSIFGLLARSAPDEELIVYLNWVEAEHMGLEPDQERLASVARVLKGLPVRSADK